MQYGGRSGGTLQFPGGILPKLEILRLLRSRADAALRQALPWEKSCKLSDGRGLFLQVTPAGGKLWRWKYRFEGTVKWMRLWMRLPALWPRPLPRKCYAQLKPADVLNSHMKVYVAEWLQRLREPEGCEDTMRLMDLKALHGLVCFMHLRVR